MLRNQIILFSIMIILCCGQFYNDRTKCSQNYLSGGSQLAMFILNSQYHGVSPDQILTFMGYEKKLTHYGYKVIQNKNQTHENQPCKNYFMSKDICCRYQDLNNYTNKLLEMYKKSYFLSKHPMVDYLYKIYDQYKLLSPTCLNSFTFNLPGRNGYTSTNAIQPLKTLINSIQNQIKVIKQHQIQFITNTTCAFCIGTMDMKTFIHPRHPDTKKTIRFLYNEEYFNRVTTMVADRMWKAKQYADQIQNYIVKTLRTKLNATTICINLTNLINNDTQINKRKMCDTYQKCIKFAQKFMGDPGAPSYSKVFASIQKKMSLTSTNFKVITTDKCGFKGNVTYERCESRTLPNVYLKGNQYVYG